MSQKDLPAIRFVGVEECMPVRDDSGSVLSKQVWTTMSIKFSDRSGSDTDPRVEKV